MIDLILALGLLVQTQGEPPEGAEALGEMFGELIDRTNAVGDGLESDDSPEATARGIAGFVDAVLTSVDAERFALTDTEAAVTAITPVIAQLLEMGSEEGQSYELEFSAGAGRAPSGSFPDDAPNCGAEHPELLLEDMLSDPEGHALSIRICWIGSRDDETGLLTGIFLYQLENDEAYVQYLAGLTGSHEAGMQPRLAIIERIAQPFLTRTIIRDRPAE